MLDGVNVRLLFDIFFMIMGKVGLRITDFD